MATSSALRLDRLEQRGGQLRPRRLEDGVAIGRELGAHDQMDLDRERAQRVEHAVAAGLEHPLEPAVARQEGALAVLYRHAQHQKMPVHGTSPSLAAGSAARPGFSFTRTGIRTRASRGRGGPGLQPARDDGPSRPLPRRGAAVERWTRRCAGGIRPGAEPVSRCLGTDEEPFGHRPDRD